MRALRVEAEWDDEASVWVATSDDIPGLVTEADTIEILRAKLVDLVPELMAENAPERVGEAALPVEIVARRRLLIAAA
jgi:hypothetical protein